MPHRAPSLVLFAVVLAACTAPRPPPVCPAQTPSFPDTFRLASKVLGEDRVINVYLPPDYAKGTVRYPVLVALDGGMNEDFLHVAGNVDVATRNEVIAPRIVVGVENTERRRDLVSATDIAEERKIAPHAGGADRFRRFLRDELRPEIARRYRATNEAAIVGESFAGLFVVETLLEAPELFDAYIAIDPSVWWNGGALVKNAGAAKPRATPKALYLATADYEATQQGVAALVAALESAPNLTVTYEPFPTEHHSTIFPVAEPHAYRTLFPATKAVR